MSRHRFLLAAGFAATSLPALATDFIGLTAGNRIGMSGSHGTSTASFMSIAGLGSGKRILGIDLRPTDNMIYGVSSPNRICTIDAAT